jgi:hypothetical protein
MGKGQQETPRLRGKKIEKKITKRLFTIKTFFLEEFSK